MKIVKMLLSITLVVLFNLSIVKANLDHVFQTLNVAPNQKLFERFPALLNGSSSESVTIPSECYDSSVGPNFVPVDIFKLDIQTIVRQYFVCICTFKYKF